MKQILSAKLTLFLFSILILMTSLLHAEMPPGAYASMQKSAPEFISVRVITVDVQTHPATQDLSVKATAEVLKIHRTATGLKVGSEILIRYDISHHKPGWVGPGDIPLIVVGSSMPAYLFKAKEGFYAPAAGKDSFSKPLEGSQ